MIHSSWRRRSAIPCVLAWAIGSLCASPLHAQTAAPGLSFEIAHVDFAGVSVIDPTRLDAASQRYLHRPIVLRDLQDLAAEVTRLYRSEGFFAAQASVPVQRMEGGVAQISVVEGRVGRSELRLAAGTPVAESRLREIIAGLHPGDVLREATYERTMLLLSDLPGLKVQSGLQEGVEAGTTDLIIEVSPAPRAWQASMELDDFGTRSSGRDRVSASLRIANLAGIGDNVDAHVVSSTTARQTFGRVAYELPLTADGWRAGAGIGRIGYELGGQLSALDASGTADVLDASLTYPLVRSRSRNATLRWSVESRWLHDRIGAVDVTTDKRLVAGSGQITWETRDGWLGGGYSNFSAALRLGDLDFERVTPAALQAGTTSKGTAGQFARMNVEASRLQSVSERNNLFVSVAAQESDRNLDASEKLALGGQGAVRAYPSGEVVVDRGWLATGEWRYSATDHLVLSVFEDRSGGQLDRRPEATPTQTNHRSLRGRGVGLSWNAPLDVVVNGSLAWHTTGRAISDGHDERPRVLVRVLKTF